MKNEQKTPLTGKMLKLAVARDVRQLILEIGLYQDTALEIVDKGLDVLFLANGKQLHEIVPQVLPNCKACAIGACLLAVVRIDNNFKIKSNFASKGIVDHREAFDRVAEVFGAKQTCLIEIAYGQADIVEDTVVSYAQNYIRMDKGDVLDAIQFGQKYNFDHQRLAAIMQNIIDNDGVFKP